MQWPSYVPKTNEFRPKIRLGEKALVYLDDVIIYSDIFEDHLKDTRHVFELLREAKLTLDNEEMSIYTKIS